MKYMIKKIIIGIAVGLGIIYFRPYVAYAYNFSASVNLQRCIVQGDYTSCGDYQTLTVNNDNFIFRYFSLPVTPDSNNIYAVNNITYHYQLVGDERNYINMALPSLLSNYRPRLFDKIDNCSFSTNHDFVYTFNGDVLPFCGGYLNTSLKIIQATCTYTDNSQEDCTNKINTVAYWSNNNYVTTPILVNTDSNGNFYKSITDIVFTIGTLDSYTGPISDLLDDYKLSVYDINNFSNKYVYIMTDKAYSSDNMYGIYTPGNYSVYEFNYPSDIQYMPTQQQQEPLTPEQQAWLDNIQQQQFNADLWIGSVPDSDYDEIDTIGGEFRDDFVESEYSGEFIGLFNSLFEYPIEKLEESSRKDLFYSNGAPNYTMCYGETISGDPVNPYHVTLFTPTNNSSINDNFKFDLPCPLDLWSSLHSPRNSYSFVNNFMPMYQGVIDGLLVYYLIIECIKVYKYILDSHDSKIEVLEL